MNGRMIVLAALLCAAFSAARAQAPSGGPPPAVGVAKVKPHAVTETQSFVGRVEATQRVALVARVTAFLERQDFTEGAEVKAGDLLYVLEQGPFQADLAAKQASVAQAQAQLDNAKLAFDRASTAAEDARRPAIRGRCRARHHALRRRPAPRGGGAGPAIGDQPRATPKSTRRSTARSGAPR